MTYEVDVMSIIFSKFLAYTGSESPRVACQHGRFGLMRVEAWLRSKHYFCCRLLIADGENVKSLCRFLQGLLDGPKGKSRQPELA